MDKVDLALKMSKMIHDICPNVPHDIGLRLLSLVEVYYDKPNDGLELANWILEHRMSVFLEADISHKSKKEILRKLNYSIDILQ